MTPPRGIPTGKLVYIDTMVWVYYVAQKSHRENPRCVSLMTQIERGEIKGVISSFVLTEAISATRKAVSEAEGRVLTKAENDLIRESIEQCVRDLGIKVHDADSLASTAGSPALFDRARELILNAGGHFTIRKGQQVWKGIGGADAIHLAFAERCGADMLATCDGDFKQSNAAVAPAILREVYG